MMNDNILAVNENMGQIKVRKILISSFPQGVEEKSEQLAHVSAQFQKDAHTLERMMYYRKMKMNCIICFMIFAVIMWFLFPYIWEACCEDGMASAIL